MTMINVDLMLKYQNMAIELEKKIKAKPDYTNKFAKQQINGAKDIVNYSYGKDKDVEWYVKYVKELEKRI